MPRQCVGALVARIASDCEASPRCWTSGALSAGPRDARHAAQEVDVRAYGGITAAS
jgi:hypothetical protein